MVVSRSGLRPEQGTLVLRVSGAPEGNTPILSSSVDLIDWVQWLTNVAPSGVLEAQVPRTGAEPRRFFRAIHR
ncbi:MAG: hypothetical protein HY735_18545 [Verrucomicrobia bacterium]|nr:hypothetical protein [Verrucomicrobiota bacterium]